MKLPINCPICGDILVTEFVLTPEKREIFHKVCGRRINHKIEFRALKYDNDSVDFIRMRYDKFSSVLWYVAHKLMILNTDDGDCYDLPFFEPDFSNYKKLRNKIKMCLVFS